jgi:hypothetical protein
MIFYEKEHEMTSTSLIPPILTLIAMTAAFLWCGFALAGGWMS